MKGWVLVAPEGVEDNDSYAAGFSKR